MNISDACFLCVCEVQRGTMETMERRDAITPSHINSLGWSGRGSREGRHCLFVFTLGACCVPDGSRDKQRERASEGRKGRKKPQCNLSREQTQYRECILYLQHINIIESEQDCIIICTRLSGSLIPEGPV